MPGIPTKFKKLYEEAVRRNEEFYRVLIESVQPENSFVQVFWCSAKHPGQAIDAVLRGCANLGINNPILSEFDSAQFPATVFTSKSRMSGVRVSAILSQLKKLSLLPWESSTRAAAVSISTSKSGKAFV